MTKSVIFFVTTLLLSSKLYAFDLFKAQKSVIGNDARVRVTYTKGYPHRVIGHVGTYCTGTLISRDIVLTAAHCVFDKKEKIIQKTSYFRPGKNEDSNPFGQYNWKTIYVPKKYAQDSNKEYDYAFIKLSKKVYSVAPIFLLRNPNSKQDVQIAGYPGDKEFATMWESECHSNLKGRLLHYDCDTYGGMSGSPIWVTQKGTPFIIGIHTLGDKNINKGIAFNNLILKDISKIKGEGTLSSKFWNTYKNDKNYFLDEFDKIRFNNNTHKTVYVNLIYGDLKKKEVRTTISLGRLTSAKEIKTRKSSFMFQYSTGGAFLPDYGPKACKGKGLALLEGKCYYKAYIKGANWTTKVVSLPYHIAK